MFYKVQVLDAQGRLKKLFPSKMLSKRHWDLFLDNIKALLSDRFDDVEFLRGRKLASVPAEFSDEFLNRCHMVAAAFGD